eukprot:398136_1
MSTRSKEITLFFTSTVCLSVAYHVIVRLMKKTLQKNGCYEIVPLHKAQYMQSKTEKLLSTEWSDKSIRMYSSKILPTHLLLIHHKNKENININNIESQICNESDEHNINSIVIGHVALRGSLLMNLKNKFITMERVVVDPKYRGYGFGKSLMFASYIYANHYKLSSKYAIKKFRGITATKSLISFYDKLNAKIDNSFFSNNVSGAVGMYIELDNVELYNKCKTLLNAKKRTHNLILSFGDEK